MRDIIIIVQIRDVNQMLGKIFFFACADVQATIHLTRISGNYFPVSFLC